MTHDYLAELRRTRNLENTPRAPTVKTAKTTFDSFDSAPESPFFKSLRALQAGCPALVETDRWQQAVEDGKTFLFQWGDQAEVLGWTARDLFGLLTVPKNAKPSFNRLSRYDQTGLIWLLDGRRVMALTATTAAIQSPSGNVTVYRKLNKPATAWGS